MILEWESRKHLSRIEKKKFSDLKEYVAKVDKAVMKLMKMIKEKEMERKEKEENEESQGMIEEESEDQGDILGMFFRYF